MLYLCILVFGCPGDYYLFDGWSSCSTSGCLCPCGMLCSCGECSASFCQLHHGQYFSLCCFYLPPLWLPFNASASCIFLLLYEIKMVVLTVIYWILYKLCILNAFHNILLHLKQLSIIYIMRIYVYVIWHLSLAIKLHWHWFTILLCLSIWYYCLSYATILIINCNNFMKCSRAESSYSGYFSHAKV